MRKFYDQITHRGIKSAEIYPMPLFVKMVVNEVGKANEWYINCLGFKALFTMPDQTGRMFTSHLRKDK